jgi:hypothetical protein
VSARKQQKALAGSIPASRFQESMSNQIRVAYATKDRHVRVVEQESWQIRVAMRHKICPLRGMQAVGKRKPRPQRADLVTTAGGGL